MDTSKDSLLWAVADEFKKAQEMGLEKLYLEQQKKIAIINEELKSAKVPLAIKDVENAEKELEQYLDEHPSARIAFSRHLAHLYEEHGMCDYLMGDALETNQMKKRALGWFSKYLETLGEREDEHRQLITMLQDQLRKEISG